MGKKRSEQRNLSSNICPQNGSNLETIPLSKDREITNCCTHVDSLGKLTREHVYSALKSQCSTCANAGAKVTARWLCLHEECLLTYKLTTLCGSKPGENHHASAHFEANPSHCILWNLRNKRMCCMECATEICQDGNIPPVDVELRRALIPLKRSHMQSSSTPSTPSIEVVNKKDSTYHREAVETRGRSIGSFAAVNRPLAKDIEDGFDLDFPRGLTGMYNLGNTCYFNASIQVLSNCPPFSDYFRDKEDLRPYANREPLVAKTMALLIQRLWSAKREPAVFPKALLARVRDNYSQFRGWNQQDAQELIRCLLELLHSELCQPVYAHEDYSVTTPRDLGRQNSTSSNGSDQFETADSGWSSDGDTTCTSTGSPTSVCTRSEKQTKASYAPLRWRSIVTDVFDGSIESCVTCMTCKNVSVTTETFQDLSLPIPSAEHLLRIRQSNTGDSESGDGFRNESSDGYWWMPWFSWLRSLSDLLVTPSVSLEDCLSAFFSPDRLVGDDMYSCDTCKKLRNGVKICRISRLPEVLCVHIKRFRHDSYCSSKVSTLVSFPLAGLDLSNFSETSENVPLYDLCGFITHEGSGADSGHYLAYCRNEIDGNWYEYDDSTLTKLDSTHVLTKEAYVLLYQKRPSATVEEARRKTMDVLLSDAVVKMDSEQLYISSEWLLKLSTFSDPGPVTNYSFLCRHGHLLPRRADHISSLCTPVPAELGYYLLNKFGGTPAVSELHYCLVCDKHWRWLEEKRAVEQLRFRQLEDAIRSTLFSGPVETLYSTHLPPSLISRTWFISWEKFINHPCSEPPGPIDNTVLLCKAADGTERLKPRSNYMRIERELYVFLRAIYGGGPEVFLMDEPQWTEAELSEVLNEVEKKMWTPNLNMTGQ